MQPCIISRLPRWLRASFSTVAALEGIENHVEVVIRCVNRGCRCLAGCAFLHSLHKMLLHRGPCAGLSRTVLLWISLSLCSATYVQENTTSTPGYTLLPGVSSVPAPVTVSPDQNWEGIDGAWNTFSLRVGSQRSIARVVPSTASQQIWVVNYEACESSLEFTSTHQVVTKFNESCEDSRGMVFNTTTSSTWKEQGFYSLWIGDDYGKEGIGYYGYDTVEIGIPGEEGPTVGNTTISTLKTPNFWLGHLGLHPKPTNFTRDMQPVPSFMTGLFEQGSIPSLSFGYTAGVQYRRLPSVPRLSTY